MQGASLTSSSARVGTNGAGRLTVLTPGLTPPLFLPPAGLRSAEASCTDCRRRGGKGSERSPSGDWQAPALLLDSLVCAARGASGRALDLFRSSGPENSAEVPIQVRMERLSV